MKIVLVIDQFDDANNGTTISARRFAAGGCKVVINYHRSQAQAEALAAEPGLTVEQVILTESGGGRAQVTVGLTWQGEALSVTVEVS